jgi:hypothetical protein
LFQKLGFQFNTKLLAPMPPKKKASNKKKKGGVGSGSLLQLQDQDRRLNDVRGMEGSENATDALLRRQAEERARISLEGLQTATDRLNMLYLVKV